MTDRRVIRTKELLRAALLDLLKTRTLGKVSVKDVLERAQVGRTAFYAHYRDLEDLAQDIWLSRMPYFKPPYPRLADYENPSQACTALLDVLADMFGFFRDNPNLAKEIVGQLCHSVYYLDSYQDQVELLVTQMRTEYGEDASYMGLCIKDAARFIISGQFALIRSWLNDGMVCDIEEMCKKIAYMDFQCTAAVAGRPIEPYFLQAIEAWHIGGQEKGAAGA